MGVDMILYAKGEVSGDEERRAEAYIRERLEGLGIKPWGGDQDYLVRRFGDEDNEPRLSFGGYSRFYGPGYERGDWPTIHACIMAMRGALPMCKVYYGGDTIDVGLEATDELLAEYWAHWLGPDGYAYRRPSTWEAHLGRGAQ